MEKLLKIRLGISAVLIILFSQNVSANKVSLTGSLKTHGIFGDHGVVREEGRQTNLSSFTTARINGFYAVNAKNNLELAERQAEIAKKISMKFKIKMPIEIRSSFCKKCKKFIVPNISSRVRVGQSNVKSISITCNFCTHTYRNIIKN